MAKRTGQAIYRVLDRVEVDPETGCWNCTLAKSDGYAILTISRPGVAKTSVRAHQVTYETFIGPITPGMTIDHLCRNRACCNPHHLEQVTRAENNFRGFGYSGRNARAAECPKGHAYDAANTYVDWRGRRRCRPCMTAQAREYRKRKGAA